MSGEQTDLRPAGPPEPAPEAPRPFGRKRGRRVGGLVFLAGLAVVAVAFLGSWARPGGGREEDPVPTCTVTRGDMTVSITQMGGLWAMEPIEIKSAVEGWSIILEIVEEGSLVTEQDVRDGMVLVQLDASRLEEQEADRQINFFRAEAAYTKVKEDYAIQIKQNESDIAIAELNAKFARMELERYLSTNLGGQVLEADRFDFAGLGDNPGLGGAARQLLRDYAARAQLAGEELSRAEEALDWTRRLFEKGYVNRNDLTADDLAVKRRQLELDEAQEDDRLFRRYTLPKDAERRYSDYVENMRDLDRIKARAKSELAQTEASLRSGEARYELESERLEKTRDMIAKSTIRATKPGRVLYGDQRSPYGGSGGIEEGASVRENQTIIMIPDLDTLAARITVPEADIDKLRVGQPALITFEAAPETFISGRVATISPMASAEHAWLNPDAKVYETNVAVDEVPEGFIAGMSATVYIIVARLKDVVSVPVSAVLKHKGHAYCWVETEAGPQPRTLIAGHSSALAVEIRDGLAVDEQVYLAPPQELKDEELKELERAAEEMEKRYEERAKSDQEEEAADQPEEEETEPAEAEEMEQHYEERVKSEQEEEAADQPEEEGTEPAEAEEMD